MMYDACLRECVAPARTADLSMAHRRPSVFRLTHARVAGIVGLSAGLVYLISAADAYSNLRAVVNMCSYTNRVVTTRIAFTCSIYFLLACHGHRQSIGLLQSLRER